MAVESNFKEQKFKQKQKSMHNMLVFTGVPINLTKHESLEDAEEAKSNEPKRLFGRFVKSKSPVAQAISEGQKSIAGIKENQHFKRIKNESSGGSEHPKLGDVLGN